QSGQVFLAERRTQRVSVRLGLPQACRQREQRGGQASVDRGRGGPAQTRVGVLQSAAHVFQDGERHARQAGDEAREGFGRRHQQAARGERDGRGVVRLLPQQRQRAERVPRAEDV